jgi:hypothetical protein
MRRHRRQGRLMPHRRRARATAAAAHTDSSRRHHSAPTTSTAIRLDFCHRRHHLHRLQPPPLAPTLAAAARANALGLGNVVAHSEIIRRV